MCKESGGYEQWFFVLENFKLPVKDTAPLESNLKRIRAGLQRVIFRSADDSSIYKATCTQQGSYILKKEYILRRKKKRIPFVLIGK
jgi:hypothetical protein